MRLVSKRPAALLYWLITALSPVTFSQQPQPANKDVPQPQTAVRQSIVARDSKKRRKTVFAKNAAVNRTPIPQGATTPVPPGAASPVTSVNKSAEPEYLSGQAEVTVSGNYCPIIRLGLAQNGSTVIEFPASDNFFAVHPGGSNIVAVDESPTLATDHYLVFRAGRDFAAPTIDSKKPVRPEATVSVQMQSGMFVTFMFYPVSSVTQMIHRCVVSYSRAEVVAARRAIGLAVNLDGKNTQFAVAAPITSSTRIGDPLTIPETASSPNKADGETAVQPRVTKPVASTVLSDSNSPAQIRKRKGPAAGMTAEAQRALQSALDAPEKFVRWTAGVSNLSMSALPAVEIDEHHRLTVVAVKNIGAGGVRLVGGEPFLDLETIDEAGRAVQVQTVSKLYSQSTALGGAVPAGATVYYAIIYEPPVLGRMQRLRVLAAQMDAADDAASVFVQR